MKTAAVHSRIDPETKLKAETILQRLGMTPTEAIRLFYTQITLRNGLPFPVEIPNDDDGELPTEWKLPVLRPSGGFLQEPADLCVEEEAAREKYKANES